MTGDEVAWAPEVAHAVEALVASAVEQRRAYRQGDDETVVAILPDWMYDLFTSAERARLKREHSIVVQRRSDVYGSDTTGHVA